MKGPQNYRIFMAAGIALMLASCATPEKNAPDHIQLTPLSFADLDGWRDDAPLAALAAFRHSCDIWQAKSGDTVTGIARRAADWKNVCVAARDAPNDENAARRYFETYFRPYAVAGRDGSDGLFTGYYTPELQGSLQRGGAFQTPLYMRPADIVSVDLGAFKSELKGQHILGKIEAGNHGENLIPYDDRAAIAAGSLRGRAAPLVWVDDPVSAFFLEVQGSGIVRLTDGGTMTVGYDGANGHGYVAIGRVLADRGAIERPVTMPAIRAWLASHPTQAQAAMNQNPSYVFFRRLPNDQIVGAEGVKLTPGRSMAVDPAFIPLGIPVWLDTADGQGAPLRRLMVAQDTGGAIKGVVRGDFFWGAGEEAARQAGAMQSRGHYDVLLPKTLNADD